MKLWKNVKAASNAATIVTLAVGFLLFAILTPIAMEQIVNGTTGWTGWDSTVETIFTVLLPILFVIGVAVRYIPKKGK